MATEEIIDMHILQNTKQNKYGKAERRGDEMPHIQRTPPHLYNSNWLALPGKKSKAPKQHAAGLSPPVPLPKEIQTHQPQRPPISRVPLGQKFSRSRAFLVSGFCCSLGTFSPHRQESSSDHGQAPSARPLASVWQHLLTISSKHSFPPCPFLGLGVLPSDQQAGREETSLGLDTAVDFLCNALQRKQSELSSSSLVLLSCCSQINCTVRL